MESNLTDKQIDKIMFHYFDDKFKNSFFGEEEIESGTMWTGFFVSDSEHMLLGKPYNDDGDLWFSHGPILSSGTEILGLSPKDYHLSMKRYLNKKYPEVEIGRIM